MTIEYQTRIKQLPEAPIENVHIGKISKALKNTQAMEIAMTNLGLSYARFFPGQEAFIHDKLFRGFSILRAHADDQLSLAAATQQVIDQVFDGHRDNSWFKEAQRQYKRDKGLQQLAGVEPYILQHRGKPYSHLLEIGCGKGSFMVALANAGYRVTGIDVIDIRSKEARAVTEADNSLASYYQMQGVTDICLPFGTTGESPAYEMAFANSVLHHVEDNVLVPYLQSIRSVTKGLIITEDVILPHEFPPSLYSDPSIPYDDTRPLIHGPQYMNGLVDRMMQQPLLGLNYSASPETQRDFLVIMDYWGNVPAGGAHTVQEVDMNMPFNFKTYDEWRELLETTGFRVREAHFLGYEEAKMHRPTAVQIVCD